MGIALFVGMLIAAIAGLRPAGLFPAWDIMFRSYDMPKHLRPTDYGVHEDVPSGWWAQMKYPLEHS